MGTLSRGGMRPRKMDDWHSCRGLCAKDFTALRLACSFALVTVAQDAKVQLTPDGTQFLVEVDMDRQFPMPSDAELAQPDGGSSEVIRGILADIKAHKEKISGDPSCRLATDAERSTHICRMPKHELHGAASLQFEAAQIMNNVNLLKAALPLFAAACGAFQLIGVPANAALVWEVGMDMQHEGGNFVDSRDSRVLPRGGSRCFKARAAEILG